MQQSTTPLDRARAHLGAVIARHREEAGDRLPVLHKLAAEAGVSHVTMLRAISESKVRGDIAARSGSGIYLAGTPMVRKIASAAQPAERNAFRWERTAWRLEQDVLAGVFTPGAYLPRGKELCARYGVCASTLGRCLRRSMARMLIKRERRWFRVPLPSGQVGQASIILVSVGPGRFIKPIWDQRHMWNMYGLETACIRAGLGVRKVFYAYVRSSLQVSDGKGPPYTRKELSGIQGFAILNRGLQGLDYRRYLHSLARYDLPVSVVDEDGDVVEAMEGDVPKNVRVFRLGFSVEPGCVAGRFLLELGHRRIAYISPFHADHWSINRLKGLRSAFAQAGLPDAVASCTTNRLDNQPSLDPTFIPSQSRGVRRTPEAHETILSTLAPELRDILRRREVTAWVAANDEIGFACRRFLKNARVAVPQRISVMGFDDSYLALFNDLTSYNFNSSATTQAMVDHIVDPSWPPFRRRPGNIVEIDGFVTARRTTARAPA
jgi:hypothetical protein